LVVEREEVIPVPERVGSAGVDFLPGLAELLIRSMLLLDLDADPDGPCASLGHDGVPSHAF
jgi:hypothetical protein